MTSVCMQDAPETPYISGYVCPTCGEKAIGIPHQQVPRKPPVLWSFRFPVSSSSTVQCCACQALVPREHWKFVERR